MAGPIVIGTFGLVCILLYRAFSRWRDNRKIALKMGFPVYSSPIYFSDLWWLMLYPIFLPMFKRLPKSLTNPWLPMAQLWDVWRAGHRPFADAGTDSFVVATPNGNMLWSCDHAIISQLLIQHPKCEAPVDMLKFYDIWGPTIGSVDGHEWKTHRRIITAGFGNAINSTVWDETKKQVESMIECWIGQGSVVPRMNTWTSSLALHIISCGFFNMSLEWNAEDHKKDAKLNLDHITFDRALILMMKRLATVFMVPRFLLNKLPFQSVREANIGYTEVTKHLSRLRAEAEDDIQMIMNKKNKTLLESIVISGADPSIAGKKKLPEESVSGNLFFTLMAGHETTGSTLACIFTIMAIYPEIQARVQQELDQQFGDRPFSEWTVERDYQVLQTGYVGAVQKEVLMLYNPVSWLGRKVVEDITVVDSLGQSHLLPAGTLTPIAVAAAMRSDTIWDKPSVSAERKAKCNDSPALYFNPDRWLGVDVEQSTSPTHESNTSEKSDTKPKDYPIWWTFGQGPRYCPGQAFAKTELVAAMATMFKDHSLELVVDEQTVRNCGGDEKLAWEETRDDAIRKLYDNIKQNLTISIDADLPIRIVKRARAKV